MEATHQVKYSWRAARAESSSDVEGAQVLQYVDSMNSDIEILVKFFDWYEAAVASWLAV